MKLSLRKLCFTLLVPAYVIAVAGLPLYFCWALVNAAPETFSRFGCLVLAPAIYATLYVLIAGGLSRFHQAAIVPGRFPRDPSNPVYFHRRMFGLCWTLVYYFTPLYFTALSIPALKKLLFGLFGFRGTADFTTYPDTWIRDIPLLKLGKGVYLSNRATIGTNIAFPDGSILVDTVTVGDGSLVGHLAMLGPGVSIGRNSEIAVGVAIGLRTWIGDDVKINPCCAIEHGVRVGNGTRVGSMTYIGSGASIGPGLKIPPGVTIPPRAQISTQAELGYYTGSQVPNVIRQRRNWADEVPDVVQRENMEGVLGSA